MNHWSSKVKIRAVEIYINSNITQKDVAKMFEINIRTLQRWLYEYNNDGNLERKKQIYYSYKIEEKHVKYIMKVLKKNQSITNPNLLLKLKSKYPDVNITERHLGRIVRENNLTRKRTRRRHFPETRRGKRIDLKKELKLFYSVTDKFNLNKIICIDETSVSASMLINYSRCELGKRCVMKTKDNRVFKKYTLVVAMNSKGIIGWTLYEKSGMNVERMIVFLKQYVLKKRKNLIIMDNSPSHKSLKIKEEINKTTNTLQFSVPYRPKTNAVESWFNQFKHYFKLDSSHLSFDSLKTHISNVISGISQKHYLAYIKYAYESKNVRKYISKKSTRRKDIKNYKK
jgi:transposase